MAQLDGTGTPRSITLTRMLRWSAATLVAVTLVVPLALPLLTDRTLIVVDGGSMEPTLHRGDVLVTRPTAEDDLRPGRILLVGPPRASHPHRVVAVDSDGIRLRLQGDANATPDPDWVDAADVDAALVMSITGLPALLTRGATSPPGIVLLVVVLAVLLLPPRRVEPDR